MPLTTCQIKANFDLFDLLAFSIIVGDMNTRSVISVAIVITTRNRSDFLIRLLNYYASNDCSHTVYIGDASTKEHQQRTTDTIRKIADKVKIIYNDFTGYTPSQSTYELLTQVTEKYACFNGDDDYQISDSLTKCAEFLEINPDYATASGYAVNFRLKQDGPYGDLASLKNYPRPELHNESASQRVVDFLNNYFVTNISVSKTEQMRKNWSGYDKVPDLAFGSEILPGVLSIINGKAKTLDCLSTVRQMHNRQYTLNFILDWVAHPDWLKSYLEFSGIVSKKLSEKDHIDIEKARQIVRQGSWLYLQKSLTREYPEAFPDSFDKNQNVFKKKIRKNLVKIMPFLKIIYRRYWLSKIKKNVQLHYEVLRPDSPYYKDFKPVMDSFEGK